MGSCQLLLNKFFDQSTPSMRKVNNGEKRKKRMTFIVATNVFASQPPRHRPTETPHAYAKMVMILTLIYVRENKVKYVRNDS